MGFPGDLLQPLQLAIRYVPDECIEGLGKRKFVSYASTPVDAIMDPFWHAVASCIPRRISPNVISLLGGVAALTSCVTTVWAVVFGSPCLYVFAALWLFVYQTADAVDGMHARATKQATPLGIIIDHGVDAFVAFTTGLSLCFVVEPALGSVAIMAAYCTAAERRSCPRVSGYGPLLDVQRSPYQ
eukprot:TRINITY_DN36390_c0_g1_i1.p1 TRINITY_DN36390_c0_g1~~TRINITY_DN36390_c0_g1_i1.p1  ORF type:complete len:185 (-),score=5.96 TRINITY_DN36390_c0_g1_i1:110-664(-)